MKTAQLTCSLLFLLAALLSTASAQERKNIEARSDTTERRARAGEQREPRRRDIPPEELPPPAGSPVLIDSLEGPIDTTRMSTPSLVGSFDRSIDSALVTSKEDLHWIDYRSLGGVLETIPGVYVREQVSAGTYDQLTVRGVDWRSITIAANGRTLNDPASGIYNLYHFTTEFADRIEVITGPRAFLYGLNSSGGAINLVTKNYNSNKPFTKITYSETAYNYQFSDGTFSQNVSRKVNVTFGFQHQGTDGRFSNSAHDAWNARFKIRYNPIPPLNVILSEYLTSSRTNVNGGVSYVRSGPVKSFDRLQAAVINTDSYEKVTRHDVDLSIVGTFLPDTANVSTLTFYYSHSMREYRDEENRTSPNGVFIQADHVASWMGALFTQNFDTDLQRFSAGGNLEIRQVEGSPNLFRRRRVAGSAWAKEDVLLGSYLTVSGYTRFDRFLGGNHLGCGADARLRLTENVSVYGGGSVSKRLPNFQELYWTDSTVLRPQAISSESHRQLEAGFEFRNPQSGVVRLTAFHRTVLDPILTVPFGSGFVYPGVEFRNGDRITTNGIEGAASVRVWRLLLEGVATYLVQKDGGGTTLRRLPKLAARGGVYYRGDLLEDKLELKAGIRGRYQSRQSGEVFNPEMLVYVPNTGERVGMSSSIDFFLAARIGDAFFHLIWENLTDVRYFTTPYFPGTDRVLRFGISWEFLN